MGVLDIARIYNATRGSCLGEQIGIADNSRSRLVGLLGRRSLEAGTGLFIVPSQAIHTFGMAFPIDVVFVNKKYKVVGVRECVQPYRVTRVYWTALGVIELPPETIRNTRTQIGDQLSVEFDK